MLDMNPVSFGCWMVGALELQFNLEPMLDDVCFQPGQDVLRAIICPLRLVSIVDILTTALGYLASQRVVVHKSSHSAHNGRFGSHIFGWRDGHGSLRDSSIDECWADAVHRYGLAQSLQPLGQRTSEPHDAVFGGTV